MTVAHIIHFKCRLCICHSIVTWLCPGFDRFIKNKLFQDFSFLILLSESDGADMVLLIWSHGTSWALLPQAIGQFPFLYTHSYSFILGMFTFVYLFNISNVFERWEKSVISFSPQLNYTAASARLRSFVDLYQSSRGRLTGYFMENKHSIFH